MRLSTLAPLLTTLGATALALAACTPAAPVDEARVEPTAVPDPYCAALSGLSLAASARNDAEHSSEAHLTEVSSAGDAMSALALTHEFATSEYVPAVERYGVALDALGAAAPDDNDVTLAIASLREYHDQIFVEMAQTSLLAETPEEYLARANETLADFSALKRPTAAAIAELYDAGDQRGCSA